MLILIIALCATVLILLLSSAAVVIKTRHRNHVMQRPFPAEWETVLQKNMALYRHLPPELRDQLHKDILVFMAEKDFEGCGGLMVTEEMKVTIAGEACLLLLNRKPTFYPNLKSILLYPHPYHAPGYRNVGGGHYAAEASLRAGESWTGGDVVLAWDCVRTESQNGHDGRNVVLHEFAHQLDQEDGRADGAPLLEIHSRYHDWARILNSEYQRLRDDVTHNRHTDIDPYGATNPAEFFAVATESFFENPLQMQSGEPGLYKELKEYYKLDPAAWLS